MDPHHLAALIKDTSVLMHKRFDAKARHLGLSRAQWHVIWVLSRREGCNQSELADELEVEAISLCRMVDRLAHAGLVERRRDPGDRRAWLLHLTGAAAPLNTAARGIGAEVIAEALDGLTADEAEALCHGLERMRDNLSARRKTLAPT